MAERSKVEQATLTWIEYVSNVYQQKLKAANIRYTGDLEDTIQYGINSESSQNIISNGYTIQAYLDLASEWKYVEDGRLAGSFPNIDAIRQWIIGKPIIPRPYTLPSGKQVIPTTNQISFLVGRKIKNDGIAPNPLLFEALEESRLYFIELLNAAVEEDLYNELSTIFEY